MDTRFWGPSGWRLLHILTFKAEDIPLRNLQKFMEELPYVLPCKYCRASFTDYCAVDPIPKSIKEYPHWMYRIHNRVNGKLRDQKLLETSDPSWKEIKQRYEEWVAAPCSKRRMVGWDFLFSVAYTTPSITVATAPMPGAPPRSALQSEELLNRWGLLKREERLPHFKQWWSLLPSVLPFPEWREAWTAAVKVEGEIPLEKGRKAVTAWLYRIEKAVCAHLKETIPHDSFDGLCSELSAFSSSCGTSKRSKTCRATKRNARKSLKKRRRSKHRLMGGFL